MAAPRSNLTCVTHPSAGSGQTQFCLSDPELLSEGDGVWGFGLYEQEDVWLATFVFANAESATKARAALIPVLGQCLFVATEET